MACILALLALTTRGSYASEAAHPRNQPCALKPYQLQRAFSKFHDHYLATDPFEYYLVLVRNLARLPPVDLASCPTFTSLLSPLLSLVRPSLTFAHLRSPSLAFAHLVCSPPLASAQVRKLGRLAGWYKSDPLRAAELNDTFPTAYSGGGLFGGGGTATAEQQTAMALRGFDGLLDFLRTKCRQLLPPDVGSDAAISDLGCARASTRR